MYELFIEGQKADINEKISVQLTFAIDDVANFASRETSFSKQIVLPGTGRNNIIFGHIHEMGSNNPFSPGEPNIGSAFNVAQTSRAELRLNGLLILRGIFRLTGIIKEKDMIEYEGALFGELSGLMSEISNKKLEDLDFSEYDHTLTHTEISDSWDNTPGSGYFYPLIDYGNYRDPSNSNPNNDYAIGTFRPALYVKEYLDKMFSDAGYSYASDFINSDYFKALIIPHNSKELARVTTRKLTATTVNGSFNTSTDTTYDFDSASGTDFTIAGNATFTYNAAATIQTAVRLIFTANYTQDAGADFRIQVKKNSSVLKQSVYTSESGTINIDFQISTTLVQNDVLSVNIRMPIVGSNTVDLTSINATFTVDNSVAETQLILPGDTVQLNQTIPKGIFQKDFLASLLKMFNLYVYEDKLDEKKLNIVPYKDFMSGTDVDWTYKVARDKAWSIRPMGNLNGRIFEFKYKEDSDFYNEGYRKKYNQTYGDRQFDTGFQFSKDIQTTEVIFASSPLVKYASTDKHVTAIYKKSNELSAEDRTDSVIRILFSKKKSANTWYIINGSEQSAKTSYGYAGHLDDPASPAYDLNFGAPNEIYYSTSTYPSQNLFNRFWSDYIAQIADKDSKILECYVYLKPLDVAQLDFSKAVFIDGIRFRLNKVSDYDYTNEELVKVELLKIIENG